MLLEGKDVNVSPHEQLVTLPIMAYWVEFDRSCCRLMLVLNLKMTRVNLAEATKKSAH